MKSKNLDIFRKIIQNSGKSEARNHEISRTTNVMRDLDKSDAQCSTQNFSLEIGSAYDNLRTELEELVNIEVQQGTKQVGNEI